MAQARARQAVHGPLTRQILLAPQMVLLLVFHEHSFKTIDSSSGVARYHKQGENSGPRSLDPVDFVAAGEIAAFRLTEMRGPAIPNPGSASLLPDFGPLTSGRAEPARDSKPRGSRV